MIVERKENSIDDRNIFLNIDWVNKQQEPMQLKSREQVSDMPIIGYFTKICVDVQ
jgi:hypothetical protein